MVELSLGAAGAKVILLQLYLQEFGFYKHNIDGIFGEKTQEAVFLFQDACEIQIDGIVGMQTIKHIRKLAMLPDYKRFIVT